MRISLVFPPFFLESMYNLPPLGLINLATSLNGQSHSVRIHDFVLALRTGELPFGPALYDKCAETIAAEAPDVVAFSVQCTTLPPVLQISERLKSALPDVRIVLGGHNVTFSAERILRRFPAVDAVVRGEGELTFPELVSAYSSGDGLDGIQGVSWRCAGQVKNNPDRPLLDNLDDLPPADYGFVQPLSVYRDACGLPRSIATLEVGRGCPHNCVYCSESVFWRRRTRTFSVPRLIREMHHLRSSGAECFLLAYDQFTADRAFVEDFCRTVIDEGLSSIPWYCISRLDTVDAPLLGLMRQAGCESMCYGIDSGSKNTLRFIRKRIDPEVLARRVQETTATGIVPTLSFVIGFPEETAEDIEATLELALRCGAMGNVNPLLQLPTVLPGTELFDRYRAALIRGVDTYFALGLEFDEGRRLETDERMIGDDPLLFSSFHNVPCPGMDLAELDLLAASFPLIIALYPRSFLLLTAALAKPPGTLFKELLGHVRSRDPEFVALTAAGCMAHFGDFAALCMKDTEGRFPHLAEVLRYETDALVGGGLPCAGSTGNVDTAAGFKQSPLRRMDMVLDRFAYDLPMVIADLRQGVLRESYPLKETWLAFMQRGGELEVTELNEFGSRFLELCDGTRSIEEVAAILHPLFGAGMDRSGFAAACREALETLAGLGMIAPSPQKAEDGHA
jgi:hypothetical protein